MVTDELRDKRDGRYYEPGIGGPQTGSDETADESGHDEDRKIPAGRIRRMDRFKSRRVVSKIAQNKCNAGMAILTILHAST